MVQSKPHKRFVRPTTAIAIISPSIMEVAWAAGIYEGEGSTFPKRKIAGVQVTVTQNDTWILYKLSSMFGGNVCKPSKGRSASTWRLSGARAIGFLYTIYSFLSPRRKEQAKITILSEH